MTREELNKLFNIYLLRDFREDEWGRHGKKSYNNFENEIIECDERKRVLKNIKITDKKIALLISGHIRNNDILHGINKLISGYNFDVFIHSWDTTGIKGHETNIDLPSEKEKVINQIDLIPNVKGFLIENNKEFIDSIREETEQMIYFNFSSPEIFIKSQLYSIYTSCKLMKEYSLNTNTNYDIVFRLRFDCEFLNFDLSETDINLVNDNKIIFVSNKDSGHHHPDSNKSSCWACDNMFYEHELTSVHDFEHSNVICDIFAYGSQESMEFYSSTYLDYDEINRSFIDKNLKQIKDQKIEFIKNKNVFNLKNTHHNHIKSLYYLNCSYPERILQKRLKDYMLVESKNILIKFKR
jgi:hypothetical protein